MADTEQLEILKLGVDIWNKWRAKRAVRPDFRRADLRTFELEGADFREADLSEAQLEQARLAGALFGPAWRVERKEGSTTRRKGEFLLYEASLSLEMGESGANLRYANLRGSNLRNASLVGANLWGADLTGADLEEARFSSSTVWPDGYEPVEHGALPVSESFTIRFDEKLSAEQIKSTLEALADYYRACGGVGFRVDAEIDDVLLTVPVHA